MKTFVRIIIVLAAALMLISVTAGICVLYFVQPTDLRSDWQKPAEQHMARHLHDLQRDRDALLRSFRSAKPHTTLKPESLPESLRVPA